MKTLIISGFIMMVVVAQSCRKKTLLVGENIVYACPMKCEGEKVYPVSGICPVCKMNLEPQGGPEIIYDIWLTTHPELPLAGEPTLLSFTPKIKGNDTARIKLEEVHEQKLHVVIVSADLSWYDHVHPKFQADGTYTVQEAFPAGGEYIIFADYHPTGSHTQVERRTLEVTGPEKKPEVFETQNLTTETDGYKVTLKPTGEIFRTDTINHMNVKISKDGVAVSDFENIMGVKGHLVIISGDGEKYIHVHALEKDSKLGLQTEFEHPGIYRAFYQFQTNGQIHTSYFTLDVKQGTGSHSGTAEEDPPHHHHN